MYPNGSPSSTSTSSSSSRRLGSMLKDDFPGGFDPLTWTVCLWGQFRLTCPSPPHPKHLPAARSSASPLSVHLEDFWASGLDDEAGWDLPRLWFLAGTFGESLDRCECGYWRSFWADEEVCDPSRHLSKVVVRDRCRSHPWACLGASKVTDLTDRPDGVGLDLGPISIVLVDCECPIHWSRRSATFSDISMISAWATTCSQVEISGLRLSLHSPFWITAQEPFQNLRQ